MLVLLTVGLLEGSVVCSYLSPALVGDSYTPSFVGGRDRVSTL